ncbi:MAG: hypothetical protein SFT92_01700 [Rickettsiales bacterium]|nr:hypothetical protein [Rickettsiales bacterium]
MATNETTEETGVRPGARTVKAPEEQSTSAWWEAFSRAIKGDLGGFAEIFAGGDGVAGGGPAVVSDAIPVSRPERGDAIRSLTERKQEQLAAEARKPPMTDEQKSQLMALASGERAKGANYSVAAASHAKEGGHAPANVEVAMPAQSGASLAV